MKIVFVIEQDYHSGGGFFHTLHTLNVIYKVLTSDDDVLVLTSSARDDWDDITFNLKSHLETNGLSFIDFVQSELDLFRVDLVFYLTPTPTPLYIRNAPYIYTIWDLGRYDLPAFPEYQHIPPLESNQEIFRKCLQSAIGCIVPSSEFAQRLSEIFQIGVDRFIEIPISINPKLSETGPSLGLDVIPGMIFYPAQFWAHKNHVRLIDALKILQGFDSDFHLVFCGGDKGSLANVMQYVESQELTQKVNILGFVENSKVAELYQEAEIIALPSYLGPNILPIYEAWYFRKPLASSTVFQAEAISGAIFFDPNSAESIAAGIKNCRALSKNLIEQGDNLLKAHQKKIENLNKQLKNAVDVFRIQQSTWAP